MSPLLLCSNSTGFPKQFNLLGTENAFQNDRTSSWIKQGLVTGSLTIKDFLYPRSKVISHSFLLLVHAFTWVLLQVGVGGLILIEPPCVNWGSSPIAHTRAGPIFKHTATHEETCSLMGSPGLECYCGFTCRRHKDLHSQICACIRKRHLYWSYACTSIGVLSHHMYWPYMQHTHMQHTRTRTCNEICPDQSVAVWL